ncbi:MAG: hypothetical protein R2746_10650 [Acidimicrobiales bacterium]
MSSSTWASITSATLASSAQRSAMEVRDHESNASRAASQAAWACSTLASGAVPTKVSVAGFMTS